MKKYIFKSLIILALAVFAVSCSEEPNAVQMNEENTLNLKSGSSIWDGVIGVEKDGQNQITIPIAQLKKDFEDELVRQGHPTTLVSFEIGEVLAQDSINTTYAVKGYNGSGLTIARFLQKDNMYLEYTLDRSVDGSYTTCTGCATGCHLRYAVFDGKKVAYCDEGGCYYNCEKTVSGS